MHLQAYATDAATVTEFAVLATLAKLRASLTQRSSTRRYAYLFYMPSKIII
jgi:hypothetical protein